MKRIVTLAAIMLTMPPAVSGQTAPQYGKVTLDEMTMKSYTPDKTCEAVVLYDIGKSYFTVTDEGFRLVFERKTRIKIFAKSGFRWAEIEIPFYYEGDIIEKVSDIEASSYNIENGLIKQTRLDLKQVFEEKTSEYWRQKKLAIPNVKEGTVIEYKYTITSPYMFNLHDWKFQHSIPVKYSEYIVKVTPFYDYIYVMTGQQYLSVKESYVDKGLQKRLGSIEYQDMVYRFVMETVPAFTDESFITSVNDCIFQIDFQLSRINRPDGSKVDVISTWPKLINDLLKDSDFGSYAKSAEKAAAEYISPQAMAGKSHMEKFELLVNTVKAGFSWNGQYSYFARKSLKEFMKEKTGNTANINLFLAGLLNAAGFEAYPVIISTRDHGKIKSDYPFAHFFNDVIVLVTVDGKHILTDATQALCPFNTIPPWCINEKGLVVKKGAEDWVMLTNDQLSTQWHNFIIKIAPDGNSIKGHYKLSSSHYDAFTQRKEYQDDTEKVSAHFVEKGYTGVDSVKIQNFEDPLKNYNIMADLSYMTEIAGDKIYFSPFMLEAPKENPLKQATRLYPVDMNYLKSCLYGATISIPEGYGFDYVPADYTLKNNFVDVDYSAQKLGENILSITAHYEFKKSVYEPGDYDNLRYTLNEAIKKLNEKIVLKKIH